MTGIQDERFDVAHEPDRSVHLGLDVVVQRVPVAGLSQLDERHRRPPVALAGKNRSISARYIR
jgi:hypothetical protein